MVRKTIMLERGEIGTEAGPWLVTLHPLSGMNDREEKVGWAYENSLPFSSHPHAPMSIHLPLVPQFLQHLGTKCSTSENMRDILHSNHSRNDIDCTIPAFLSLLFFF